MEAGEYDVYMVTDRELEDLTALAEFEIEHRRLLSMQRLYKRRAQDEGAA